MLRKIITIDREKCVGCKLCVNACQEGAIGMVDGKAALLREDYCDGLGNCLPVCPVNAITFEEREAPAFSKESHAGAHNKAMPSCPGSMVKAFDNAQISNKDSDCGCSGSAPKDFSNKDTHECCGSHSEKIDTQLRQWPVQIKLVPVNAPYFDNANLLIAADCCAYAYGNFHNDYMKNKISIIGCPKLDEGDYSQKLTEILKHNNIKSVTVTRMQVPCCGGLERAVVTALQNCGKMIPWQVVTISPDGKIIE